MTIRQFNVWFQPELCLAIGVVHMDVHPRFLT
jgi:hypothetical protein